MRVFQDQVKMHRLVNVVEKREGGGINENVNGGQQAQEQHDATFPRLGRPPGGIGVRCVHP
jgi:hypothetical protein